MSGKPQITYACHCTLCQRQSGSAFGMTIVVAEEQFHIRKGVLTSHDRMGQNGRTLSRYFCSQCGTWIFNMPDRPLGFRNIKPGTLDDASWVRPDVHLWTGSALPWVRIPDDVRRFERQPPDLWAFRASE